MRKNILSLLTSIALVSAVTSYAYQPPLGFKSGEHIAAGDSIKLSFSIDSEAKSGQVLHLPNGLQLTFGELVTMGDFYGVIGQPIAGGKDGAERKAVFVKAFNSFARESVAVIEMPKIMGVVQSEQNAIAEGKKNGEKLQDVYDRISLENNRLWNCVTGGGCAGAWYLQPGRYLLLAEQDIDHFGNDAWLAYEAGHEVAIDTARAAHLTHDLVQLELAYAMEAFADHFLSDRFATGHMRIPRAELPAHVIPNRVGDLLVNYMHEEENYTGLHVHNQRGDHWLAYGDKNYVDSMNDQNRVFMLEAMQVSANEVFAAYQAGEVAAQSNVKNLIPMPDEKDNLGSIDVAPLFYWDEAAKTLYRRSDVYNINDRHWTANWWGWSTLILLSQKKPLSILQQAELVRAGLGAQAMGYGLIKDKNLRAELFKHSS